MTYLKRLPEFIPPFMITCFCLAFSTALLGEVLTTSADSAKVNYGEKMDEIMGLFEKNEFDTVLNKLNVGLERIRIERGANDSLYYFFNIMKSLTLENLGKLEESILIYKNLKDSLIKYDNEKHPFYGTIINNLGKVYAEIGNPDKAIENYILAIDHAKKILGEDDLTYAIRLNNLGLVYSDMGNYSSALPYQLKSLELTRSLLGTNHPTYAVRLNNLSITYSRLNRHEKALELLYEALEISQRTLGDQHTAVGNRLYTIASNYRRLGREKEALPLLYRALKIYKTNFGPNHRNLGVVYNTIAGSYFRIGEHQKAEKYYMRSLEITRNELGENHPSYSISLGNLATMYTHIGSHEKALSLSREVLELYRQQRDRNQSNLASHISGLVILIDLLELHEEAIPLFFELMDIKKQVIHRDIFLGSMADRFHLVQRDQKHFDYLESFAFRNGYQQDTLRTLIFNNSVFLKNLILNSFNHTLKSLQDHHAPGLQADFNTWKILRDSLSTELSRGEVAKDKINELKKNIENLETKISLKSSNFRSTFNSNIKEDIQAKLNEDEVLIDFSHFENFYGIGSTDSIIYTAIILEPNKKSPTIIPLFEERTLDSLLSIRPSENKMEQVLNLYGNEGPSIYELIIEKLYPYLKDKSVMYYSPSGLIHQLNLNAVMLPDGKFLGEKLKVIRLHNPADLLIDHVKSPIKSIALFGGIDYGSVASDYDMEEEPSIAIAEDPAYLALRAESPNGWKALKGTYKEVTNISNMVHRNIDVAVFEGRNATEEVFKNFSGNSPTVIHLSTHGFFLSESVDSDLDSLEKHEQLRFLEEPLLRSGLILAGANQAWVSGHHSGSMEDGILTAYEISNLDLSNTDLVVLSACDTGLGEIKGNDGVFGLQRAFKMAGVKYVIMSLWKVPDQQTQELMELFYTKWFDGIPLRDAFRNAQIEMAQKYPPYFWAGFVLMGGGSDQVVYAQTSGYQSVWVFSGLILFLIFLLWYMARKRKYFNFTSKT